MNKKLGKRSFAALAGSMVVAGPVLAACSPGPTYDQWAATDGAAGRINLEAVQDAFKNSDSVSEFESKVNEIYEGDGIILIRARQDGERLTLQAYEDLNKNGDIDGDTGDDLLFEIVQNDDNNELRGHGANGYYRNSFGGGNFLFTYLLLSSFSRGPYFYQTSPARASTIRSSRTSYRNSTSYRSQVSRNGSYFNKQKTFAGSRYSSASRNVSPARQTYQSSQKASGAFKSSGTGVRSSWGSSSRSSRGGIFGGSRGSGGRGFGGSQVVIGFKRG